MARLFGCPINVEAEEEGGGGSSTITGEASRSGNQPDGDAMILSGGLAPFNQRESNPYFRFLESNSDSGSVSMDSESDLHNCFIDFFDRESYEVSGFHIGSNQRRSTSVDFDIWGSQEMEEIELGLGIGSGSSGSDQLRGDSGGLELGLRVTGNKEIDSGRVEVGTGLTPVGDDLFGEEIGTDLTPVVDDLFGEEEAMVADEELEWEDLQNAVTTWVSEPVQASLFILEEDEQGGEDDEEEGERLFVASMDENQEDVEDLEWQVLLPVNHAGLFEDFFEESLDIIDSDLMDFEYGVFLSSIDLYGENPEDYDEIIARTFEESGIMGSPPASKRVVDDLPVVEITSEELSNGNIACAICKDEIVVKEKVKKLPCRHYYHGDCIIPWLGIRNTCPVCRYELPTDDLEYERNRRRSQRRGSSNLMSE